MTVGQLKLSEEGISLNVHELEIIFKNIVWVEKSILYLKFSVTGKNIYENKFDAKIFQVVNL